MDILMHSGPLPMIIYSNCDIQTPILTKKMLKNEFFWPLPHSIASKWTRLVISGYFYMIYDKMEPKLPISTHFSLKKSLIRLKKKQKKVFFQSESHEITSECTRQAISGYICFKYDCKVQTKPISTHFSPFSAFIR